MWYRIACKGNDFTLEWSAKGEEWTQMRLCHLHNRQRPLHVGIYACSPKESSFVAEFSEFDLEEIEEE